VFTNAIWRLLWQVDLSVDVIVAEVLYCHKKSWAFAFWYSKNSSLVNNRVVLCYDREYYILDFCIVSTPEFLSFWMLRIVACSFWTGFIHVLLYIIYVDLHYGSWRLDWLLLVREKPCVALPSPLCWPFRHRGSGDAVDVLASVSCTSRAVVGLAGPRLQLLLPLVLCDGGVFTATMASVASSLIPWLRVSFWLSLSHSSMISWLRAHDLGLHCVVVWLWFGHGLICWLLASIFAVKLLSSGIAGYPK
jgi:hypothetical protein